MNNYGEYDPVTESEPCGWCNEHDCLGECKSRDDDMALNEEESND